MLIVVDDKATISSTAGDIGVNVSTMEQTDRAFKLLTKLFVNVLIYLNLPNCL
jgi:hypothetical protein